MIESPCIGICTLVEKRCIGCFRTKEQISSWLYFSDRERKKITKECLKKMEKKNKNQNT